MTQSECSLGPRYQAPGDVGMTWLIAERAAVEALQDRLSLLVGVFFALGPPIGVLTFVVHPLAIGAGNDNPALRAGVDFYLLVVGLLPAISAVGIAAGQFAGEKERGVLTPLLASPASNLAIFGGKVMGAVMPPLAYATLAEAVYLVGLVVVLGPAWLRLLSLPFGLATIALVPAVTWFAAIVASLISSRVRTFNAAQQIGGLVLMPVWGVVFGLGARGTDTGTAGLVGAVAGLLLLNVVLTVLAAATWRREEVLAHG